jgi:hypothetical protein
MTNKSQMNYKLIKIIKNLELTINFGWKVNFFLNYDEILKKTWVKIYYLKDLSFTKKITNGSQMRTNICKLQANPVLIIVKYHRKKA